MTNYELIKAMSVEEMTEFLKNTSTNTALKLNGEYVTNDKEFILIWLESEVESEYEWIDVKGGVQE